MVMLADLKEYLKIDQDITDDDSLISSLADAAISYLEQTTGKAYNDDSSLMHMAVCQLVLLWYENRTPFTTKTNVNDIPNSLNAIIKHIALAQAYPDKENTP